MNSGKNRALFIKQLIIFEDQVLIISHYFKRKLEILGGRKKGASASHLYAAYICFTARIKIISGHVYFNQIIT